MEVPGSRHEQLAADLNCAFVENLLVFVVPNRPPADNKNAMQQNWTELVPQTWSKLSSHA